MSSEYGSCKITAKLSSISNYTEMASYKFYSQFQITHSEMVSEAILSQKCHMLVASRILIAATHPH